LIAPATCNTEHGPNIRTFIPVAEMVTPEIVQLRAIPMKNRVNPSFSGVKRFQKIKNGRNRGIFGRTAPWPARPDDCAGTFQPARHADWRKLLPDHRPHVQIGMPQRVPAQVDPDEACDHGKYNLLRR
jgi:hypothetical protein